MISKNKPKKENLNKSAYFCLKNEFGRIKLKVIV